MFDTIFETVSKVALVAVKRAYVDLPEDEDFKHQLSDGTWLLTKIPMGIDTGWREWIGSLRYESLSNSNLILVKSEGTSNPEILDGQHLELERKVSLLFHILQLSGVLEYSEANLVVGSFYNGQSDVRRMSRGKIGGRLGTLLTMLNNSIAVADRMEPTIQESKGEISQHSQQRPLKTLRCITRSY